MLKSLLRKINKNTTELFVSEQQAKRLWSELPPTLRFTSAETYPPCIMLKWVKIRVKVL